MEYWRKTLADAPEESSFPTDRPRPAVLSTRGDRVEFVLDAEIGTGVRRLARAARATPFAVLAAALAALVAHASGQDDVVIGTPVSRRDDEDLTPMIACLSDVLPLRQRVSPQDSFADLVARAKAEVWGAVAHRDAPYSHLIRDLNVERSPGRFPLFQVVFGLDDAPDPALDLPGVTAERMYAHAGTAKYDVFLHLIPEAGASAATGSSPPTCSTAPRSSVSPSGSRYCCGPPRRSPVAPWPNSISCPRPSTRSSTRGRTAPRPRPTRPWRTRPSPPRPCVPRTPSPWCTANGR